MIGLIIILVIVLAIGIYLTIRVGNYFVNYALVVGQGGADRDISPADAMSASPAIQQSMEANVHLAKERRDHWLEEVTPYTEEVAITAYDGVQLTGHQYLQPHSTHQWVILLHGYQLNENYSLISATRFYQMGYHVLTVNMRAHGHSGGDYIGMSVLDQRDVIEWIRHLIHLDSDAQIVLYGVSMGAASALMTAGRGDLPTQVQAVIADCSFSSVWEMFHLEITKRFHLWATPIIWMANIMTRIHAKYWLRSGNVVRAARANRRPTLIIHGNRDDFVPLPMAEAIYHALAGPKELLVIHEAGHAEAQYVDPGIYYQTIAAFLDDYVA